MAFLENILQSLGLNDNVEKEFNKIMIFGDKGAFFEGIKGIKAFSSEQIILFAKKGEVLVKGERLYIKKFCMGDVVICGKIKEIARN